LGAFFKIRKNSPRGGKGGKRGEKTKRETVRLNVSGAAFPAQRGKSIGKWISRKGVGGKNTQKQLLTSGRGKDVHTLGTENLTKLLQKGQRKHYRIEQPSGGIHKPPVSRDEGRKRFRWVSAVLEKPPCPPAKKRERTILLNK